MKRFSLVGSRQAIACFMFTFAGVSPLYSQEITSPKTLESQVEAQKVTQQSHQGFEQENAELLEKVERSGSVQISGRAEADRIVASRFTLNAGGTPALPALTAGEMLAFPENESANQDTSTGSTTQQTGAPRFVFPTRRERFNRYVKSAVGPFRLLRVGVGAGINQWRDHPEEWEQGASGYGKRFASGLGRNVIQQTVIYGLDSALGLDTGFRRSGLKGFFPRMKHALAENITSRTRTGKRVISVPRITGVYASKIISDETWYPPRYSYKDGLRSGTKSLLTDFGINLIREFVFSW